MLDICSTLVEFVCLFCLFFFFLEYALLQEYLKLMVYAKFGEKQSFLGESKIEHE